MKKKHLLKNNYFSFHNNLNAYLWENIIIRKLWFNFAWKNGLEDLRTDLNNNLWNNLFTNLHEYLWEKIGE